MKQINWNILVILIFILVSGGCYSLKTAGGAEALNAAISAADTTAAVLPETAAAEGTEMIVPKEVPQTTQKLCYVHICGAVAQPGVYQVAEGERIFRVVELAGGYTEDAVQEYLNLAAAVADGMKLMVPTAAEFAAMDNRLITSADGQEPAPDTGKINLNTATKEQLMKLSGIGEAKAEAILKYRKEHGNFVRPEDIMKIPGIKQAAFDRIKDEITIKN